MPQVDFFAVREDHQRLLDFILAETDFRVLELYSAYGQQLREFTTFDQLAAVFDVGCDQHGHGSAILLALCSPSVITKPPVRRVKLDPRRCDGFTFRYAVGGGGVAQLYLGGVHDRIITTSHFGHFSEKGAVNRGYTSGIDWKAMSKLSNRIRYHISKRLAAGHAPGRPVLSAAFDLHLKGYELKESARGAGSYRAISGG